MNGNVQDVAHNSSRLVFIKTVHTAVWLFFNFVLFYMLYEVLTNQIDEWVWIGIACVLAEGLVLLVFKNMCPLTLVARKYSGSEKANFDIYLPEWLANYNKTIYTIFFLFIIALLLLRLAGWQINT